MSNLKKVWEAEREAAPQIGPFGRRWFLRGLGAAGSRAFGRTASCHGRRDAGEAAPG